MDGHRAVAGPSDLLRIGNMDPFGKSSANISDSSIRSLSTIIGSTGSRNAELTLEFDAGFEHPRRLGPTRCGMI
jgi:hypothetical protein